MDKRVKVAAKALHTKLCCVDWRTWFDEAEAVVNALEAEGFVIKKKKPKFVVDMLVNHKQLQLA